MEKFKRINREKVYDGAILEFCKDEIITPEGKKVYWDFLQHKGAAAVIPVMSDGRIIMVRQWSWKKKQDISQRKLNFYKH